MFLRIFKWRERVSICSRYYDSDDHPNDLPLQCPTDGPDAEWDMPDYKTQAVYYFGKLFLQNKVHLLIFLRKQRLPRYQDTLHARDDCSQNGASVQHEEPLRMV